MKPTNRTSTEDRATRLLLLMFSIIGIVVLCIVAYANSFDGVFLFDDGKQIVENASIRQLDDLGTVLSATPRPVTNLTLALNYAAAAEPIQAGVRAPAGFHLVNLLIHMVAALALFALVLRALLRKLGQERSRIALAAAVVCAGLWAVHPLQTQSVTYIIQRSESMMGMFFFLTLLCLDVAAGRTGRSQFIWGALAIGVCALGMGSKAVMIAAPVVALLYDRAFLAGSFAQATRKRWWLHVGLFATCAVLLLTGEAVRVLDPSPRAAAAVGFGFKGVTPVEYLLTQPGVILHYLKLTFWPSGQMIDPGWSVAQGAVEVLLPLGVLLVIGLTALYGLFKNTWWGFVGTAFFVALAPTSSVVPIKDLAFEHRMYVPLACVVIAAVVLLWRGMTHFGRKLTPQYRTGIALLAGFVAIGALTAATIARNELYTSEAAMWRDVVAKDPGHWRAWNNLGITLTRDNDLKAAEEAHRKAHELQPDSIASNLNLALTYHRLGRRADAERHYLRAIELDPTMHDVRANYGDLLIELKRFDDAETVYAQAIEGGFRDTQALMVYAGILFELGRFQDSLPYVQEASRRDDADGRVFATLGNTYSRLEDYAQAEEAYRSALTLSPNSPDLWYNLGVTYSKRSLWAEAEEAYSHALRLHQGFALAHFNLGLARIQLGKREEAAQSLRTALRYDPSLSAARTALDSLEQATSSQ